MQIFISRFKVKIKGFRVQLPNLMKFCQGEKGVEFQSFCFNLDRVPYYDSWAPSLSRTVRPRRSHILGSHALSLPRSLTPTLSHSHGSRFPQVALPRPLALTLARSHRSRSHDVRMGTPIPYHCSKLYISDLISGRLSDLENK